MKSELLTVIDYQELEGLIAQHLGQKISVAAEYEARNDSYVRVYGLSDDVLERALEEREEGLPYPRFADTEVYVAQLKVMGVLPAGQDVLVSISW